MSSNVTLVDKLNPIRHKELKVKIDEICHKSLKNLKNTSKILIEEKKHPISSTKVSINYIENENENKNNLINLENFYKKYLLKFNDFIMKKKLFLNPLLSPLLKVLPTIHSIY
ncbi:hypothetical protein [Buchnera aphidicola]|jgi:hypothetical protein|uniref:Uncharacterized protein BUsg_564 n=1 Tax=Buchnera aphidicola subsp. Schizaphis graminum (strain Sg) TaxID=198804 RepID=Y564_BUCAP|nr:hypothetical protein [Buchnera aphidicola]Q8K905.1 RecName: Full=Uncharacterized protein BUsg_564; AltName: Full=yba4 [Buchnera aphidicola str. Sg (Schizaphis graminum)]AAM68100.1 hypothetical protein BUsg_564 [Buchnera aphidicola str. Sg (Schizaphis graminum)]AWI49943.1 hypothetical protein DEO29_03140 [Buchnera aphidicola (Schizaphis graminum)]